MTEYNGFTITPPQPAIGVLTFSASDGNGNVFVGQSLQEVQAAVDAFNAQQ